jgi:hypothetical protein
MVPQVSLRVELTDRSLMLYFGLVSQIKVLNVDSNVTGNLGLPVVAGYEL